MSTTAPIIAGSVLVDAVIADLQQALVANLPWLDVAFGRSQRITRQTPSGRTLVVPNVFCGGWNGHGDNDYIEVSPDARIGNFCFFEVQDPENVEWSLNQLMNIETPFSLIFWFDTRTALDLKNNRDLSHLKNDILTLLNGRSGFTLRSGGHLRINRIYERADNIYRGYTLSEIDNQYLMHPYAGFRFDGVIKILQPCLDAGRSVILYNTSDADVTPEDVIQGVVAYGAEGKIVGTFSGGCDYNTIYERLSVI